MNLLVHLALGQGAQGCVRSGKRDAICHSDTELHLPPTSPTGTCLCSRGMVKKTQTLHVSVGAQ